MNVCKYLILNNLYVLNKIILYNLLNYFVLMFLFRVEQCYEKRSIIYLKVPTRR